MDKTYTMEDKKIGEMGEKKCSAADYNYKIFDFLKHPACVIGPEGELFYSNRPFKDLFQDTGSMQLDLSHPFYPEYRKRMAMAYMRALKGFERQCFAIMKSSENKRIPVEIFLFPVFDGNSVSAILAFLKPVNGDRVASFDQSAKVMADEYEETSSQIFQYSPFPILRIDSFGKIIDGTSSLETFTGFTLEELKLKRTSLIKALSLYDFERIRKAITDIFNGNISFKRLCEINLITKEKEDKWVNAIIYPVTANKQVFAVDVILEDYTKIKKLENRMSVMNRIQIVGDLTKGLLHSFSNMINVIMSRTQLLLQMTEKDVVLDGLRLIEKTALDSVKQIRRIQDFIGEGESLKEFELEDLIDVIEDAIEFSKIHFKVENKEGRRNIKVERRYFAMVNVRADTRLLREIFVSMIFKVSAFLKKHGTINIMLKDNGSTTLTVLVNKEDGEDSEPRANDESLSGLIFHEIDIRRIAEKLNIKIIEEESSASYTIKAVLPPSILINKAKKEPDVLEYKLRDLDIIIVEDETALKEILFELFDSMGNRVFVADNGEDALSEFRKGDYDLVITDYGMKGMTGLELLTRTKEVDEDVVTVLLSGWMLNDLKAYKNVVDLFLPKPFKLDVLIKEISKIFLSKSKQGRQ